MDDQFEKSHNTLCHRKGDKLTWSKTPTGLVQTSTDKRFCIIRSGKGWLLEVFASTDLDPALEKHPTIGACKDVAEQHAHRLDAAKARKP